MATKLSNHPGRDHDRSGDAPTKKWYVRIEGRSQILSISKGAEREVIRKHRKQLRCPDEGCTQRLRFTERRKPRYSPYLSNEGDPGCGHFSFEGGGKGGGGPMTEEHAWVQERIREICLELGYEAALEADFGNSRIDVLVRTRSGRRLAIEVQRGDTGFSERIRRRAALGQQTLWVIPDGHDPKDPSFPDASPLFNGPSVRLWYHAKTRTGSERIGWERVSEKLAADDGASVDLRAGATVGEIAADQLRFHPQTMGLKDFLAEVLDGKREWISRPLVRGKTRGSWAGWLRRADLEIHRLAEEARRVEAEGRRAESARHRDEELERCRAEHQRRREELVARQRQHESVAEAEQEAEARRTAERAKAAELACRAVEAQLTDSTEPGPECVPTHESAPSSTKPSESWWKLWWRRIVG